MARSLGPMGNVKTETEPVPIAFWKLVTVFAESLVWVLARLPTLVNFEQEFLCFEVVKAFHFKS